MSATPDSPWQISDRSDGRDGKGGKKPRSRLRRWLLRGGLALLIVLLVVVSAAPTLVSWFGTSFVESAVNSRIAGSVRIDSLSFGWLSGQSIDGIELDDPDGRPVATIERVSTELGLFDAVLGDLDLGRVEVASLRADVVRDASGSTNLERAVAVLDSGEPEEAPEPDEPARVPGSLAFDFALVDARVTFAAPGVDKVMAALDSTVGLASPSSPLAVHFSGKTSQGDLAGDVSIAGKVLGLFSDEGLVRLDRAQAMLALVSKGLPIGGVDRLLALDGLLEAALGDRLDVTARLTGTTSSAEATLSANAPNLKLDIGARATRETLGLEPGSSLGFTATPDLVSKLVERFGEGLELDLIEDGRIDVEVRRLDAPLGEGGVDLAGAGLDVSLRSAGLRLSGDERVGDLELGKIAATISSSRLSDSIDIDLAGELAAGGAPGSLSVKARAAGLVGADGTVANPLAGLVTRDAVRLGLSAKATTLPIGAIDRILALEGILTSAVGDRLDLSLDVTGEPSASNVGLRFDAANLRAELDATATRDGIQVKPGARLTFTATPALTQALAGRLEGAPTLEKDVELALVVDRLAAKLGKEGVDLAGLGVDVRFAAGDVKLVGDARMGALELRGLGAKVTADRLGEAVALAVNGEIASGADLGRIAVNGTVARLLDASGKVDLTSVEPEVEATIDRLPTALIAGFTTEKERILAAVGEHLSIRASARSSGTDRVDAKLSLESPTLEAKELTIRMAERIALVEPAEIRATVSRELINPFLGSGEGALSLDDMVVATVRLDELSMPRPKPEEPAVRPAQSIFRGGVSLTPLALSNVPELGKARVENVALTVGGESLASPVVKVAARLSETGSKGLLVDANGSPWVDLSIEARPALRQGGELGAVKATASISGGETSANLAASVAEGLASAALESARVSARISPELAARYGLGAAAGPRLAASVPLDLTVEPTTIPLEEFSLAKLVVRARASIGEFRLTGDERFRGTALRDTVANIAFEGARKTASVVVTATTVSPGRSTPGSIAAEIEATGLLDDAGEVAADAATVDGVVSIASLPTALVDAVATQDGKLVELLGVALRADLRATIAGGASRTGTVDVKLASDTLAVDAGLALKSGLALSRPATFSLELTPKAYSAWTVPAGAAAKNDAGPPPLALTQPTTLRGTIDLLRWPLPGAGEADDVPSFDASLAAIRARLSASDIVLFDPASRERITLAGLDVRAAGEDLSKPLAISVAGRLPVSDGAREGSLALTAELSDLFKPDGAIDVDGLSTTLDATVGDVPSRLVDALLQQDGLVVAALGETVALKADAELERMSGPVTLGLAATRARASIKARVDDQVVTFTEPAIAEVDVTKELGSKLLVNIHPIFASAERSDRPIRLRVADQGASIPLRDFALERVVLPEIDLDLGEIVLENGGLLAGTIDFLKRYGELDETPSDRLSVWFTPAVVSLRDGRVTYTKRLDLLIDRQLHLATWGVVELVTDNLDMTLAVMAETVARMLKQKRVDRGNLFGIPLRGLTASPRVDWIAAATDFGRLEAEYASLESLGRRLDKNPILKAVLQGQIDSLRARIRRMLGSVEPPPASADPLPWKDTGVGDQASPGSTRPPDGGTPTPSSGNPDGGQPEKKPGSELDDVLQGVLDGLLRKKK